MAQAAISIVKKSKRCPLFFTMMVKEFLAITRFPFPFSQDFKVQTQPPAKNDKYILRFPCKNGGTWENQTYGFTRLTNEDEVMMYLQTSGRLYYRYL